MITKEKFTTKDRYESLIRARNFHYENFNKWTTYFYIAIGTLFVGYCTLMNNEKNQNDLPIKMVLILGYFISLLWYWSSKGYYFWNINFITLVNECEEKDLDLEDKERVYYTFANKKTQNNYFDPTSGANISTSKIAILFAFIVSLFWGIILLQNLFQLCIFWNIILSLILTLLLSGIIPRVYLKSKIDHFPDLKIKQ